MAVWRGLIRNLQSWRSLYEALEVPDTLLGPDQQEYSLWDVTHVYEHRHVLPDQMRIAIELCLYNNIAEKDAAVKMGVSASNPVSVYANAGLVKLLAMARSGELPLYRQETAA